MAERLQDPAFLSPRPLGTTATIMELPLRDKDTLLAPHIENVASGVTDKWSRSVLPSEVREWAIRQGFQVGDRGRIPPNVVRAWNEEFPNRPFQQVYRR
jgi:hypothetical protein